MKQTSYRLLRKAKLDYEYHKNMMYYKERAIAILEDYIKKRKEARNVPGSD